MAPDNRIILFQEKQIRRLWYADEWYFSVIDIVRVLSESSIPSRYWGDLKRKIRRESGNNEFYEKIVKLKFEGTDGKMYPTDCAETKTLLRIIQSIASPNAEPFKRWLSEIGYERIQEIENPEHGFDRLRDLYRAKGYAEEWIDRRLQTIDTRRQLTDEWKNRGVQDDNEYAILTAQIAKATFGVTPSEHKNLKGLNRQNLRDHMTPLELIFTALSEESTRIVAVRDDAQGFQEGASPCPRRGWQAPCSVP